MTRQFAFLLALGLLIAAAGFVSISGWVLFARDRRASRRSSDATLPGAAPTPDPASPSPDADPTTG